MDLPTVDQYNEVVQNPQSAFTDPALRGARVRTNAFGIPLALGGGFALTYTFTGASGQKWAVRCFHKPVDDLGERYAKISQTLNGLKSRYFVGFEYQPQGIRVNGTAHPIVKMEWVDGETLGSHLDKVYRDKASLLTLRDNFRTLERFLRGQNIAHGDLQNGNVMVGRDVRLIDYDGLYVPGLPTGRGTELGHRHFQHPRRQASDHGPALDRFSFISIDLALSALAEKPELFKQFSSGENILFSANDYFDPDQSAVFQALQAIPSLKLAVERFAQVCAGSVADVPTLESFLKPTAPVVSVVPHSAARPPGRVRYLGAFEVLDSRNFERGMTFVGQRVELIGKITEVNQNWTRTRNPQPYVFINFGDWRGKIFQIVIWSEGLANLPEDAQPTTQWTGRWISVTGLLDPPYFNPKFGYTHLSVTVTKSNQMRLIAEQEALWRLASIGQPPPDLLPPPVSKPEPPPESGPDTKPEPNSKPQPVPPRPSSTSTPAQPNTTDVRRRNQGVLATIQAAPQLAPISAPAPQSPPRPQVPVPPQPEPPKFTPPLSPHLAPAPISPSASTASAPTVQPALVTPVPSPNPQPYINRSYPVQPPSTPSPSGIPAWVIWLGIGVLLVWLISANRCENRSTPATPSYSLAVTPSETSPSTAHHVNSTPQDSRPARNNADKPAAPKKPAKPRVKKRPSSPRTP